MALLARDGARQGELQGVIKIGLLDTAFDHHARDLDDVVGHRCDGRRIIGDKPEELRIPEVVVARRHSIGLGAEDPLVQQPGFGIDESGEFANVACVQRGDGRAE